MKIYKVFYYTYMFGQTCDDKEFFFKNKEKAEKLLSFLEDKRKKSSSWANTTSKPHMYEVSVLDDIDFDIILKTIEED